MESKRKEDTRKPTKPLTPIHSLLLCFLFKSPQTQRWIIIRKSIQHFLYFPPLLLNKFITTTCMALIPTIFGGRRSNVFDPFSLDVWDPFEGFPFSNSLPNLPSSARETSAFANTRIDWKETPQAHIFKADLPGIKKEEVKVEVEEGRVLQISGERSKEHEEKNDKWHRIERSSGKFMRRFRLPENAKAEEVKASMENGVLTVTVPKIEEKKPEVKSIDISG